jgi:hypothetical protein
MSRRALWQSIYERFDPEQAAQHRSWRADRELSPAKAIDHALDRPFGIPRVLLTGTVGTGKTTELFRLAEARTGKEFVVFLDLERHFSEVVGDPAALQNVSSWEVCFLAGVALLRAAEERLGFQFPAEHLRDLERAWSALAKASGEVEAQPRVDVAALAKSMVVVAGTTAPLLAGPLGASATAGLTLLQQLTDDAPKWSLPIGLKKRALPDQDHQMQTLRACVNVLIGLVQLRATKVLLILDGLDRIRDFERAKALFVDSKMIAELDCRTVLCGPFALRHHPAMAAIRGFSSVPPLVNEPVLLQRDPTLVGPGVHFFCDLYQRRVAELDAHDLIPQHLVTRLAYYSGGRARDFVTFVRELAGYAWDADAEQATDDIIAKVLDEQRRKRETGLHRGHIELLASIAEDPEHRLPEGPLAQELLSYGTLLPYPNESEWYYPHPLLTMHLVRPKPSGSPGSSSGSG